MTAPAFGDTWTLLATTLIVVPLEIAHLRRLSVEDRQATIVAWVREGADAVGHGGGSVMLPAKGYRSAGMDGADMFAALAQGLAAGAYLPGGITFLGRHWCVDHDACRDIDPSRP